MFIVLLFLIGILAAHLSSDWSLVFWVVGFGLGLPVLIIISILTLVLIANIIFAIMDGS